MLWTQSKEGQSLATLVAVLPCEDHSLTGLSLIGSLDNVSTFNFMMNDLFILGRLKIIPSLSHKAKIQRKIRYTLIQGTLRALCMNCPNNSYLSFFGLSAKNWSDQYDKVVFSE